MDPAGDLGDVSSLLEAGIDELFQNGAGGGTAVVVVGENQPTVSFPGLLLQGMTKGKGFPAVEVDIVGTGTDGCQQQAGPMAACVSPRPAGGDEAPEL